MREFTALTSAFVLTLSAATGPAPAADAATAVTASARVTGEQWLDGRTVDLTVASPALGGTGKVRMLMPAGWSRQAGRTWPVLWLLHGAIENHLAWTTKSDVEQLTAGSDVIVVMPDGGLCGWYSDWWNQGRGGPPRWETHHLTEIRQILERDYRAGNTRAIAGVSMGGLGAMSYAARHPGMFRAVAAFSGALNTLPRNLTAAVPPTFIAATFAVGCPGTNPNRLWGTSVAQRAIWQAHNPYDLAPRLRGLKLYVSAGSGFPGPGHVGSKLPDPVELSAGPVSRDFAGRLTRLGIPVQTHFYAGTHDYQYFKRELRRAYPLLLGALGR